MTTNIESRIEALEAKLVTIVPEERQVFIVVGVNPDRTVAPIVAYSDWNGHTLEREPEESPETFQARAEAWVRFEHRHDDPRCLCALWGSSA